jgi:hypothetical protein
MSNTNTETWGNIELPGLSDEKLFKTNWTLVAANREVVKKRETNGWAEKNKIGTIKAKNNLQAHKNRTEANRKNAKDSKWQEANQRGAEKRKNDPIVKLNHIKAMKKVHSNPMTAINRQKGIDNRNKNNKLWLENMIKNSSKAKFKPIVTPEGIFESLKSASEHYSKISDIETHKARYRLTTELKKNPIEFFLISQEEYIMLTGKDI